jgi:hypothetical protein
MQELESLLSSARGEDSVIAVEEIPEAVEHVRLVVDDQQGMSIRPGWWPGVP